MAEQKTPGKYSGVLISLVEVWLPSTQSDLWASKFAAGLTNERLFKVGKAIRIYETPDF